MNRCVEGQADSLALEVLERVDAGVLAHREAFAVGNVFLDVDHRHPDALREAHDHRRRADVADVHAVSRDGREDLGTAANRGEVGLDVGTEGLGEATGRLAEGLWIGGAEVPENRMDLLRRCVAGRHHGTAGKRRRAHVEQQLECVAPRKRRRHFSLRDGQAVWRGFEHSPRRSMPPAPAALQYVASIFAFVALAARTCAIDAPRSRR